MGREPLSPPIFDLDQQLIDSSNLAKETQNLLRKCNTTIPSAVMDNLSRLASRLDQISKDVRQYIGGQENLVALVEISQVINSSLESSEVLRIVMDTIVRLTHAERGFLMLRGKNGKLAIQVARNWEQESINPSEFAISHTVVSRVIAKGIPVLTTNAQEDPRFGGHESIVAHNLRSILCVPLKVKGELTGVIYADNRIRSGIFSKKERDMLAAFANQAAVAIENARLFESVRRTLAEVTQLKNLMDNVFASIASGVITADTEKKITLCNQAAELILGNTGLVGKTLDESLPAMAPHISRHIHTVWRTNQSVLGVEINSQLPGRGPISLSLNLSPLKGDSQPDTQGVAIVLNDLTEKKRLEGRQRLFERMVSPAVIDQLDPDKLQLGGQRKELTALFADIRGFTTFSEHMDPERLVAVLNLYLAAAVDAVLAHEGTIDKFQGDSIMAWFNAPIPQPDHTLRAVCTALEIRDAIHNLKIELPPEYHLSFGAGIHCGEAVLGLIGTEKHLEYTAIGDSINTTKRIQENAAAGQILISAEAFNCVSGLVIARPINKLKVKGKRRPLPVYEVIRLKQ
jgi:adenylate cyclase